MKTALINSSKKFFVPVALLAVLGVSTPTAEAAAVDSEILILVDRQTFSNASFDFILDSVAQAFEQQSFVDSVVSGPFGAVAASLMIFDGGGTTTQIPWMELSSAGDLQSFADSVRNVNPPFTFGGISYVDAITTAAASIANSASTGTLQQISIIEDGSFFFFSDTGAEIQAARDAAVSSGVDVINSVVYNAGGGRETLIQNYYDANVVAGGGVAEVVGGTVFGAPTGAVAADVTAGIVEGVVQPTISANNLAAVPEPSSVLLLGLSSLVLLRRRR